MESITSLELPILTTATASLVLHRVDQLSFSNHIMIDVADTGAAGGAGAGLQAASDTVTANLQAALSM